MEANFEEAPEQEVATVDLERLSACAREALAAAHELASELGDGFVGTDHLLLGLASTPNGAACQVLHDLQLTSERLIQSIRFIRGSLGAGAMNDAERPFSPRLTRVLALAAKEAAERGDGEVGTIHLLMGLLRTREGLPVFLLEAAGLGPKRIDLIVNRVHRSGLSDGEPAARGNLAPEASR